MSRNFKIWISGIGTLSEAIGLIGSIASIIGLIIALRTMK